MNHLTENAKHLTIDELEAGVDEIRSAPKREGVLELIVRRPTVDAREVLEEAQLNIMNARVAALVAAS